MSGPVRGSLDRRPCWFSSWLRRCSPRRPLPPPPSCASPDARGDTRSPADIVGVTLGHGDRVVVRVHHRDLSFQTGEAPATLRVIYAVPGHSPGPDYWLKVSYQVRPDGASAQLRATGATPAGPLGTRLHR